jgi:hypothetical protein
MLWRDDTLPSMSTGEEQRRANAPATGGALNYDIPGDTFSVRLVIARHHAGRLSIEQAAKQCGLNPGNWAHWEDGRRPRDAFDVAHAVSEGLQIDRDWLMFGGPLLGARGRPAKRAVEDTGRYRHLSSGPTPGTVRPQTGRPKVRTDSQRPISPPARPSSGRRAVYVNPVRSPEAINAT